MALAVAAGKILKGSAGLDKSNKLIKALAKRLAGKSQLAVGLPSDSLPYPDGTDVIVVGAIHEFGGEINNPGGVAYGYETREDAEAGRVRFLKKGSGFLVLGETEAFTFTMPERSFLRSTLNEERSKWLKLAAQLYKRAIDKNVTPESQLRLLGEQMQIDVQKKIDSGPFEPNAPAYAKAKAAKGKTKVMIVTGHLRGSIRWVFRDI